MGFGKEPLAELQALITSGATWHATTLLYARRDTRSRLLHKRRARSASCLGFLGVFCLTQPSSLEALWRGWHADMRCVLVPWLTGHGRRAACRAWGDAQVSTQVLYHCNPKSSLTAQPRSFSPVRYPHPADGWSRTADPADAVGGSFLPRRLRQGMRDSRNLLCRLSYVPTRVVLAVETK